VDPLTHGLASFAVTRTIFPRLSRGPLAVVILSGTIADVDLLSAWFGPSSYLAWHRTATHSLLGAAIICIVFSILHILLGRSSAADKLPLSLCVLPVLCAVTLHLVMDFCQSDGMAILWPFRPQLYSFDWVAHLDFWIFAILLCGALLPRLFGMVTTEIGAKSKGPKGRAGAALSLVAVLLYIGVRAMLHGIAIADLESRTYRGESARRWAAFPEPAYPFHWRGIVETESALHEIEVNLSPGATFDPDAAVNLYKPEPSAALDAARNTETARRFLRIARFPRATVEKTPAGYRIEIRAFPYRGDSRSGPRVMALIGTDANAKVLSEELVWNPASREFWISDAGREQTIADSRPSQ
jgi:inner membrane protein